MKYKAKQMRDGKWAVFTGSNYYISSVTESKQDAEEEALIRSMRWYHDKAQETYGKLEKLNPTKYGDYKTSMSDLLC